jgi:dihydrolipoamide dehydrogenase
MSDRYDVIVLGMGPGGEAAAEKLQAAGKAIAVVERDLIGGECAYWGCIPSKTLLRPPEARSDAGRAAGVTEPELVWPQIRDYRNYMVRHYDDSGQVDRWQRRGAIVLKGHGRVAGPGRVDVDGRNLEADHIVIATGAEPITPPIDGLTDAHVWTNREATALREIPSRAVFIGGGAVGVELSQFLGRMGSAVTVVEIADRLLGHEDPSVGQLIEQALSAEGITIETGRKVTNVRQQGGETAVELDTGDTVPTDVIVAATGRRPRIHDLGLETVGIDLSRGRLVVDDRCAVADGVWAIGDVTAIAQFTHVAKYQGRVVADNILGKTRRATYRAIPRVVFSDPEVATVGYTMDEAHRDGVDLASMRIDLADLIARPYTYERQPRGSLGLLADRPRRVLIGAWAVAPLASEWIHLAALAIRAETPIDTLLDTVAQFPTYSEAYLAGLERLDL